MAKAILKTQENTASVSEFLDSIPDAKQREDAQTIDALMQKVTGEPPKMWGKAIIGYGSEHLAYESGRELDWLKLGFSPRKQNISLYVLRGGTEHYEELLKKLGKHELGKGCLYIKNLSEIDLKVLEKLIKAAMSHAHSTSIG